MTSCQQQKAMEKLLHGHGCANQLKRIMDHSESSDSFMEREDLARSVLHSFSDALSILIDTNDLQEDQQSNNSSSPQDSSPQDYSPFLGSGKKPLHKRGRKSSTEESSECRRLESANPIYHDGYPWRKYGQKQIKESLHQRSYFKCSYSTDQECNAKKQVQMIQENPPLYSITYFGHHTCQLNQAYATFPMESTYPHEDHPNMIRFDHPNNINFSASSSSSPNTSFHQYQNQNQSQNQNQFKDQRTPEKEEDWCPSEEVAHALQAFEFNPFRTFNDFS